MKFAAFAPDTVPRLLIVIGPPVVVVTMPVPPALTVAPLAMSMVTLPDVALAEMPIEFAAELVEMLPVTLTATLPVV